MDTAEFDTAAKRVSSSAKAWGSDLNIVGRQATAIGSTLTRTLTLPILGVGVASIKAASDFESSFAGIRKTVDGVVGSTGELTAAGLAIQQGMRDMAKEIPVSVNELNKVGEAAGQLGIKKDDILQFTRTMADLGVTTNLTAEEAASATAKIQNIFGAAGKDVDRFGATLVALGNDGASTEKDIIEMGLRIAGAGKTVGLTQSQVLSFASALSSVGINAEAGGSAISRVFLKISSAVAKGGGDMAEFARIAGMSASHFKESFEKDAAGATTAFIAGIGRLKAAGENVNATLEGVVGKNIILKDTLLRASGAGDLLSNTLKLGAKAWEENAALTKEAGERYKTFESQLKVLWNQIKDVGITLGTALLPTMKDLVALATPMVEMIGRGAEAFAKLPEPVRLTAVGILGLVAAAGPLIWMIGQLSTGTAVLVKAFAEKGLAMRVLNGFMKAAAVEGSALSTIFGGLSTVFSGLARILTGPVGLGIAAVDLLIRGLTGNSHSLFSVVGDIATVLGDKLVGAVKAVWSVLEAWSKTMKDFVTGTLTNFSNWILDNVPYLRELVDMLKRVGDFIGLVTKEGANYWKEQAQLVRDRREVSEWLDKTSQGLAKNSAKSRDASVDTQHLAAMNRVLAKDAEQADARLKAQTTSLGENEKATAKAAAAAKKAHEERLDRLKEDAQLEAKIKEENAQFKEQATAPIEKEKAQWRDFFNWLGERRMESDAANLPLKSTMDLSKMFVPLKAAAKQVRTEFEKSFDGISDAFKNIGNTILAAVTGGGNIISAIGSSLGMGIGQDLSHNLGSFLTKNLGKTLGNAVGAMLPGLGALLGPGLELAFKGVKKLFGIGMHDELKKFNAQIAESKNKLIDTYGSFERIQKLGNRVGVDLAGAWQSQGEAGKKHFDKLAKDFAEAVAKMESELEDLQGEFEDTLDDARELGYEFDQQGNFTGVNFDKLKEKAEEFGVSLDGLGPAFRQQRIDQEAKRIIDGFELMAKAGGDVGGILFGMKDEISKLVQESITMGTTIPANMKPWIQELIRAGLLTDENGEKITDIGKIKFGDPIKTEFEKISIAILDLIAKIQELIDILAEIPENVDTTVTTHHQNTGEPSPSGDGGGVDPNTWVPDGFGLGTMGRLGSWFGNFPQKGFKTALHGIEAVVTPEQAVPFALDTLGINARSADQQRESVSRTPTVQNQIGLDNHIILDGTEMKRWVMDTFATAIENNEGGARTKFRDALGVTS
jgi:TP901 family phage tail tape measure protein